MAIDIFDPAILGSYASGFLALVIALFNLYKARESAKLRLSPIVEIGTMKLEENFFFYIPLLLSNVGAQPANLEWIDLYFEDTKTKEKYPFYITKNVDGRKIDEIKSKLPLFPISILGHDFKSVVIEFAQGKKKEIQVNQIYNAMFTFYYNNNKRLTHEVQFELKSDYIYSEFSNIKWSPLKQRIEDPEDYPGIQLFGRDL